MKRLIGYADEFIKQSDWKVLTMVKFCLCAMGVLIGLALPNKARKPAVFVSVAVFFATYIPLMSRLLRIVTGRGED